MSQASIYNPSEHALGSLGITRGLFLDFEYHSAFMWTGMISKALLCGRGYFFYGLKRCALKNTRIRVDGALLVFSVFFSVYAFVGNLPREVN